MNIEELDSTNNENLKKKIKDALKNVKEGGLNRDSIIMITCLKNEIEKLEHQLFVANSTIRLIKKKEVFATYEGDRSKPYDVDKFELHENIKE